MIEGIIRKGKVSVVDENEGKVRCYFPDDGIISGWLNVVRNPPFIPSKNGKQQTEITSLHSHEVIISPWMPDVGDVVLCLYETGFNGDGYVLGAL